MIDTDKLSDSDRRLLVEYNDHLRDMDSISIVARAGRLLGNQVEKKAVMGRLEKPIQASSKVLNQLRRSENFELRTLADRAMLEGNGLDAFAEELRRLARRIKLDLATAEDISDANAHGEARSEDQLPSQGSGSQGPLLF